jgi:hypothetical protein
MKFPTSMAKTDFREWSAQRPAKKENVLQHDHQQIREGKGRGEVT